MAAQSGQLRYDFYQTETTVNVSVFAKGMTDDNVNVDFGDRSIKVTLKQTSGSEIMLTIDPLFADIQPQNSSFKIVSTKIDVALRKSRPGLRWPTLEGASESVVDVATPSYNTVVNSAPPKRQQKNWDNLATEDEVAAGGPAASDGEINSFFQKLYADADDDTRRAMMKSYQESNGTSLSTNWADVSKGKVETKPPSGMEAKKYEL